MPLLVQVSLHYRPIRGGQEVYIANLSNVLADAGWETKVIQPYKGEKAADVALTPRIPWVTRYLKWFDELQFPFCVLSQAALLHRADLILCHYASTAFILGLFPAWRRKTIVLSHGVEWNVDRMDRHDRVREWNAKRWFTRLKTVANDTDYLRRMGLTVPPREGFFSEVAPGIWFIPNCVDVDYFSPAEPSRPRDPEAPLIVVPRQICEDRGIHLAIQAFSLVAVRFPKAVLSIVGPERSPVYLNFCKRLIVEHGLENQVRFCPAVSNRGMLAVYREADVTVIPTLRREGTSLSALESMACGTPAVVTDVAGLKDLPAERCEPVPAALAAGIIRVLEQRDAFSARQRAAVKERFNFANWEKAWLRVFVNTLSDLNGRGGRQ